MTFIILFITLVNLSAAVTIVDALAIVSYEMMKPFAEGDHGFVRTSLEWIVNNAFPLMPYIFVVGLAGMYASRYLGRATYRPGKISTFFSGMILFFYYSNI